MQLGNKRLPGITALQFMAPDGDAQLTAGFQACTGLQGLLVPLMAAAPDPVAEPPCCCVLIPWRQGPACSMFVHLCNR